MDGKPIIVGTDGSQQALAAVEWAAREAALHGTTLRIVSIPAMPPRMTWYRETPPTVADVIHNSSEQALADGARRATKAVPGLEVSTSLLTGSPDRALADAAPGASMLTVGSRGVGGFAALVLGSVSRYLATNAASAVTVVREEPGVPHDEIVVGISDPGEPAVLGFAFEEARLRRARLRAIHAWRWFLPEMRLTGTERPGADARDVTREAAGWLAQLMTSWRGKYPGVEVLEDVFYAHPGRVLAGASAKADLVVLGRKNPQDSGSDSTMHAVLNHAHSPVTVIPE